MDMFLKIPPVPRVKDTNSIIAKAFYRNKNYNDPYRDITDKVGIRYVVLLRPQIKLIEDVITQCVQWSSSKDKDFDADVHANPEYFNYQSVHYVVRNIEAIDIDDINIPSNTPCEIQIRTLLQHAHSELTHDTVYKPKKATTPEVKRMVAQSMALIEVTDDIFEKVNTTIGSDHMNTFMHHLVSLYRRFAPPDYEEKLNLFILDAYGEIIPSINVQDIEEFISRNTYIQELIKKKSDSALLYRQPVILLLYFLIMKQRIKTKRLWPLTDAELRPLFSDLGISFEGI
jgi:ppGpp synthetase/RelA/SpoT-type nucleotidyltranferase